MNVYEVDGVSLLTCVRVKGGEECNVTTKKTTLIQTLSSSGQSGSNFMRIRDESANKQLGNHNICPGYYSMLFSGSTLDLKQQPAAALLHARASR